MSTNLTERSQRRSGWKSRSGGKWNRTASYNRFRGIRARIVSIMKTASNFSNWQQRRINSTKPSRPSKKTNSLKFCFRTARYRMELCVLSTKNRSISWLEEWKVDIGVSDGFRTRDLRRLSDNYSDNYSAH